MELFKFTWFDYSIFSSVLSCSLLIGIYFGLRRDKNEKDYLLGGDTKVLPVAASIVASNITGVTIIAMPADVYQFGAMYLWCPISFAIQVLTCMYVTMPVLLNIGSCSVFEYLELRFNRRIRFLASTLSIIYLNLLNALLIYTPSILLAQLTGFSITSITIIGCIICIFYTTMGGLNAVIWTDTLQAVTMFVCLFTVLIIGVNITGGLSAVWTESLKGGRLDIFKFPFDATTRDSTWSIILGYTCAGLVNFSISQSTLQRLMSLKSDARVKKVLYLHYFGLTTLVMFINLIGLSIYARYSLCDPLASKKIEHYDQIVAYYVMDIGRGIFGLSGLFVAGTFSAGLSTLSTNLNSLAVVIYSDFILPFMSSSLDRVHRDSILKLIVTFIGVLCVILACLVQYIGGLVPLVSTIIGSCGAPLFGLYILGMTLPKSNSTGALSGAVVAIIFILWLTIGSNYYKYNGFLKDEIKPISIEWCNLTEERNLASLAHENDVFILYKISYFYYAPISIFVTITVGFLISLVTRKKNDAVRPELIAPLFRYFLPQTKHQDSQYLDEPLRTALSETS